ncbi:MAG: SHOCT domain-containing protein [Clostridia bacterium]|nr:SHOCT domain-containing protein [Clostridia bacterium]
MKEKIFYWVKRSILFIIALMSLLSLCFVILKYKEEGVLYFKDTGFSVLNFKSSAFVFLNQLGSNNVYDGIHIFLGIFSILQLVYSISAILVVLYTLIKKSNNKLQLYIIIGALFFALANMIVGIILRVVWLNEFPNAQRDALSLYLKTTSFVPLIIQGCLLITYLVINYLEKQDKVLKNSNIEDAYAHNQQMVIKVFDKQPEKEASVSEEILKLKELLDAGVITQEEFDFKKKQLLGI